MVSIAFVYVPEGIGYVVDQLLEDSIQLNLERLVKNVASLITLKNKGEIFLQYLLNVNKIPKAIDNCKLLSEIFFYLRLIQPYPM
jgi:hypothetical protein